MSLKEVHILIMGTWDYADLKLDMIKVKNFEMERLSWIIQVSST